jgi:hypothetical protein
MALDAVRVVRKMRGGAQAHLLQAGDGNFYVVKFRNNPQHPRILVNEMIASVFLEFLGIAAPAVQLIRLSEEFLRENPEAHIQLGARRMEVAPGWHFGSRYPGDPDRLAVYDFLPDALLRKVENMRDYLGILAFDKWMSNADARQSVFFRARLREWTDAPRSHPSRVGFVALMVDHGFVFNGPQWEFTDSAIQGLYFRTMVYESVRGLDDFEPWLSRIENFPETVVDEACRKIPPEWLDGDDEALESILDRLLRRRERVADLIHDCRRGRANPFPNWK